MKCSAIGEPVPEIKITDEAFEPDLSSAAPTGQLGLRTATKVYTAIPGVTPAEVGSVCLGDENISFDLFDACFSVADHSPYLY